MDTGQVPRVQPEPSKRHRGARGRTADGGHDDGHWGSGDMSQPARRRHGAGADPATGRQAPPSATATKTPPASGRAQRGGARARRGVRHRSGGPRAPASSLAPSRRSRLGPPGFTEEPEPPSRGHTGACRPTATPPAPLPGLQRSGDVASQRQRREPGGSLTFPWSPPSPRRPAEAGSYETPRR